LSMNESINSDSKSSLLTVCCAKFLSRCAGGWGFSHCHERSPLSGKCQKPAHERPLKQQWNLVEFAGQRLDDWRGPGGARIELGF